MNQQAMRQAGGGRRWMPKRFGAKNGPTANAVKSGQGFVTLRSEETPLLAASAWDAPLGCIRAARVQVETAYRRLITRERMAVLCRGSSD
jgi:hypothetical protein